MPKISTLTARQIEGARCPPGTREVRLRDAHGLYLRVTPASTNAPARKTWYVRRRHGTTDTSHRLGDYPAMDLKEARRAAVRKGDEPLAIATPDAATVDTFGAALDRHMAKTAGGKRPATLTRQNYLADCLKTLRPRPLHGVTSRELDVFLEGIAAEGHIEKAHRLRSLISAVFEDATILDGTLQNPAARMARRLPARNAKKLAAITDRRDFGKLLRDCYAYEERIKTRGLLPYALQLLPLLAVRQKELRMMRWSDIDLDNPDGAVWNVPADDVKTGVALCVPLSRQAVEILKAVEIYGDREGGGYVFEGRAGSGEPLSENAINSALDALGYKGKHTGHGFRSSFSTLAHEKGWRSDLIELSEGRKVSGAKGRYLRSTLLDQRRELLQNWADYCDELRAEASKGKKR